MNPFMSAAVEAAAEGIRGGHGGPFGAVLVKDGQIIARGFNQVVSSHDPTAHAEIVAIRSGSSKLGRFDLSDCELYTTCEPCPMCLAAVHWARIRTLYYGCTRVDAQSIGFDDAILYEIFQGKARATMKLSQIDRDPCLEVFTEWSRLKTKVRY